MRYSLKVKKAFIYAHTPYSESQSGHAYFKLVEIFYFA